MKLENIFYAIVLVNLFGCGITKVTEETRDQVKLSNQKQEELINEVKNLQQEMLKLRQSMADLVRGMNRTGDKMHEQNLKQALEGITSPYATELLFPPIRMIPYAQAFGAEATPEELIKVVQLLMTEVQIGFDSSPKGNKRISARQVALSAAGLIAAFAPDDKNSVIVTTQIEKHGKLEDFSLAFETCRFTFLKDFQLKPLLSRGKLNLELLKEAYGNLMSLRAIAVHPEVQNFRYVVKQFIPDEKDPSHFSTFEDSVDPTLLSGLAKNTIAAFTNPKTGLSDAERALPETQELIRKIGTLSN